MVVIFYLHDVVVWTGMAPIASFIWMLRHQWVTLLRRFTGVALLGEVCHRGRVLRFQMLKKGPVSLSSPSPVQRMSALVFISHFPEFSTFTKSEESWHVQSEYKPLSSSTFSRSMWLILANGLSKMVLMGRGEGSDFRALVVQTRGLSLVPQNLHEKSALKHWGGVEGVLWQVGAWGFLNRQFSQLGKFSANERPSLNKLGRLERWLSSQELSLLFQEDMSLTPRTHGIVNNSSPRGSDVILWPMRAPNTHVHINTQRYTDTRNKIKSERKKRKH